MHAHPQQIATKRCGERIDDGKLFEFEIMNVDRESFLLAKNDFEVQQAGSSKGCEHIRNKLQLKGVASALVTSNCSSLKL